MAHFAQIDESNVVIQVIVVDNNELLNENGEEVEEKGVDFCKSLFGENTRWVQTSYTSKFRGRYAGVGYVYDETKNEFASQDPSVENEFLDFFRNRFGRIKNDLSEETP